MSHLLEQIQKCIEAVKAHPLLSVEQQSIGDPAPPDMIERLEMATSLTLPLDIKEFYLAANGITFSYRLKSDLDETSRRSVQENGEQPDFDYAGVLGGMRLLPIQESLLDLHWKPPTTAQDAATRIEFDRTEFSLAELGARTKLFDRYEPVNDAEAAAFITDPDPVQWKVLMLDQYLADWQNSRLTDFSTYILAMCATRFTIPSRRRVFSKYRGDKEEMLRWEVLAGEDLTPALFR